MDHLTPVARPSGIHPIFRGTPIADLLAHHAFDRTPDPYNTAPLVIGRCMDHRRSLRMPENVAHILCSPGANLRSIDFHPSYAMAVSGVSAILIERAEWAQAHFMHDAPMLEIIHEVDFVIGEAQWRNTRHPIIPVAPLIYRVEDHWLYQVTESFSNTQPQPMTGAVSVS